MLAKIAINLVQLLKDVAEIIQIQNSILEFRDLSEKIFQYVSCKLTVLS